MNARVIDLDGRRPAPLEPRCSCRPDALCYPHRLSNLADLLRLWRESHASELLVPADEIESALTTVLNVLNEITNECLPDERTAR